MSSVFSSDIIQVPNANTSVHLYVGGIVKVQINYSRGRKHRLSKSTINLKVSTSGLTYPVSGTPKIGNFTPINGTKPGETTPALSINASDLGVLLKQNLVEHMMKTQSSSVVYKSVDIIVYRPVTWNADGSSDLNGGLIVYDTYRFKSGGGAVGALPFDAHVSEQSLTYALYGQGLPTTNLKPSRFLVQGTIFQNEDEVRQSTAAANIGIFLNSSITQSGNTGQSVSLIPLADALGSFRLMYNAQLEGLRNVAGSR